MRPVIIFDKSFLQSLNPDEACLLDHFFYSNLTPLFLVETLADIEKRVAEGKSPEQIVGRLAYKTPSMNSYQNVYHGNLAIGDLLGHQVQMKRLPVISGGSITTIDGKQGVFHGVSAEAEAMMRRQRGEFLELERQFAKGWREALAAVDLHSLAEETKRFRSAGIISNIEDAKRHADQVILAYDCSLRQIQLICAGFKLDLRSSKIVAHRWQQCGSPPLRNFAPYATIFCRSIYSLL